MAHPSYFKFKKSTSLGYSLAAKQLFIVICVILLGPNLTLGQIKYDVEAQLIITTNEVVPFWMRSNRYGSIPMNGATAGFLGGAKKEYNPDSTYGDRKIWDWGIGVEGRINTNLNKSEFILSEGYLKARRGPFEVRAGRTKETMGLTGDSSLTSGSFAFSGNALGIPKIEISLPHFHTLPFLGNIIAIKGNIAHGWMGNLEIQHDITQTPTTVGTFLHQKSLYGRIGRPDWKLQITAGFNHQAMWGNEKKYFGNKFLLNNFQSFPYVLTGKAYGGQVGRSKIGNHLGSIDFGVKYKFSRFSLIAYRQNFYDVGALAYLANIQDGLNGVRFLNSSGKSIIKSVVLELFSSKNQAGELWSRPTPSGDENYYNNYIYLEGWSYKGWGLGSPLISPKSSTRSGLVSDPRDFFINNRVVAVNFGMEAIVYDVKLTSKITLSKNYGTFKTTLGESAGSFRTPPKYGQFTKVNQFSFILNGEKHLRRGASIGCELAADKGGLLNDAFGMIIKTKKRF